MTTWLSVLIPCYNVEGYLEECVSSVMNQWQDGVEVILVEDCSTDGTADVVRALKAIYGEKLTCLQQEKNGGLSAARNIMLEKAAGTYVWFLDSDDAMTPGAIAELANIIGLHSPDLIMCDYQKWVPDAPLSPGQRGFHVSTFNVGQQLSHCPERLFKGMYEKGKLHAWTKVSKRSLWGDQLRFPVGKYFEDIWIAPRLALQVKSYYYCPSVWVKYRQRSGSIMASRCNKTIGDLSDSLAGTLELWLSSHPNLSGSARFAFTRFCAKCLRTCVKDAMKLGLQRSRIILLKEQFYRNCQLGKWGLIKAYVRQGEVLRLRRLLRYI